MPFFRQDPGGLVDTIASPISRRASVIAHPKIQSKGWMIDPLQNTVRDGQLGLPESDGHLLTVVMPRLPLLRFVRRHGAQTYRTMNNRNTLALWAPAN